MQTVALPDIDKGLRYGGVQHAGRMERWRYFKMTTCG